MVHLQNKQLICLIGILIEYLQITIPSGNIFENVPTSKKANILKRAYNLFQTVNNIEANQKAINSKRNYQNKPRSHSNKKDRDKIAFSSLNDFIDVQIDNTPSLMHTRPLTSNCITPIFPNHKHHIKRKRILNTKKSIEGEYTGSYFTAAKKNKSNKIILTQIARNRNYSALGNRDTTKSTTKIFNSTVEGKYINISHG